MEIIAFMAAAMALIIAIDAHGKVGRLEKRLREKGMIEDTSKQKGDSN
jgi:hypothetical protein